MIWCQTGTHRTQYNLFLNFTETRVFVVLSMSIRPNIYISFEMIDHMDQKALKDFNDHQRCRNTKNYFFHVNITLIHIGYWLYLRVENRINKKRYEI